MRKIDFFIAGGQKCGTTKLKDLIGRNSCVAMHQTDEMVYFIDEGYASSAYDFVSEYYNNVPENRLLGAKNVSVSVCENAVKRLKEHNPACKLILVVRDPVKRAYSAYWYCRRMGWEDAASFEEAIEKPLDAYPEGIIRRNCDYIGQGYYAKNIKMMLKYFPEEQIKIYVMEDDFMDMDKLNSDLCAFLGIPVEYYSHEVNAKFVNQSAMPRWLWLTKIVKKKSRLSASIKKITPKVVVQKVKLIKQYIVKLNEVDFNVPPMNENSMRKLRKEYEQKNKELESLIDRRLSSWR